MSVSFETLIEVEVEVEAEVSGCYTPARLTADPYYSTPAEGPEIDEVRVYLVGHGGKRLEITNYIDCEQFDEDIMESASERD